MNNGHTNGAVNGATLPGGEGGLALAEAIMTPPMVRLNLMAVLATIEDASARAAPLSPTAAVAAARVVDELMAHKSIRMRGWGAKLWDSLSRYNLKRVEVATAVARGDRPTGPTVNVNGTGPVAIKLEFDRGG